MELWFIIVVVILLVLDTVVSFLALFNTFSNRSKILKNKIQIEMNKTNIKNLTKPKSIWANWVNR